MRSLISINFKFMDVTPKRLVELINNTKSVKGVEVNININSSFELKYLEDLVFELKRNNLILQIHANIEDPIEDQLKYIKKLEEYSDYLGYPIVVTFHTIYDEDKEISINKTIDYLSKINSNKIIICLENLNDIRGYIRIGKDEIRTTILNGERIYFTYDIGHELYDGGDLTNLDEYMIEDIRNIHIHSNDRVEDHRPIYKNDMYWNELMKVLEFLINKNYKYNIVYEYDLYDCKGNESEDKIIDYLESIDLVSEKYID